MGAFGAIAVPRANGGARSWFVALWAALLLAGCGAQGGRTGEEQAVRDWVDALNAERYEKAASFFADGAIVEQTRELRLRTERDAVEFNRSLPCKAQVSDVEDEGDALLVAFNLSGGPQGSCDGGSARVRFKFRDGKFSEWRQLPGSDMPDGQTISRPAARRWRPRPTIRPWQWQLTGTVDLHVRAKVFDIDGLRARASTVRALHRRGRRAICYVSVGTYERFRADATKFPREVIGRGLRDFPDERWLDIRRLDLLAPLLRARLNTCARKGFDAVEPDNVDGYANRTGFPLTAADQLAFNRWVAREVQARGMAVGLKNDTGQVRALVGDFDFAVVEQCFQYRECRRYSPFVRARKAVFAAEYERSPRQFCTRAKELRFSMIYKRLELGRLRRSCAAH